MLKVSETALMKLFLKTEKSILKSPGPITTSRPKLPRILAQVLAAKAGAKPRPALSQYDALAAVLGTSEKQLALNKKRLVRKLGLIIESAVQPGTVYGG